MLSRGGAPSGVSGRSKAPCGVKRARPSVEAVVALDQQHLVRRHEGRVVPALPRVVREVVDLADPVREHLVGRDQVLGPHARGVGERQRRALHGAADRPPDVDLDDPGAGCGKAPGLGLAEQIPDPLRAALLGVVDVHPARRAAQPVAVPGAAAGVGAPGGIEHDDAAGAGHRAQQRLDLRVVDAARSRRHRTDRRRRSRGAAARSLRDRATSASASGRMSWIRTAWRSVSNSTRGAPPVNAELWNTGLVSDGVMKVSAARTSAEVRRLRAGATSRTAWVTGLPPLAWPAATASMASRLRCGGRAAPTSSNSRPHENRSWRSARRVGAAAARRGAQRRSDPAPTALSATIACFY